MSTSHEALLSPFTLAGRTLRNRIALTAHGDKLARDGRITERLIGHYERRAAGGAGLIVTGGSASVHQDAANPGMIALWAPENEPLLADLADRVTRHGAVLLCQASHRSVRESPMGRDPWLVAPSHGAAGGGHGAPDELGESQIQDVLRAYAEAARRLHRCGFDGIEVTAFGSHLIEMFWSPVLNRRTDRYGGSPDNRLRFGREVLDAVASAVPDDFVVSFRMSGDALSTATGLSPADLLDIAGAMSGHPGIDLFSVSGGSGMTARGHAATVPTEAMSPACYNHLGRDFRERVGQPVLVAGRVLDADLGERTISAGDADLVGMTRALIADPDLPARLAAGAADRVRPCIAINEGCRRVVVGHALACTVNPSVGEEGLDAFASAAVPRRIVVVGAGPAGLEAARIAATRGHAVTIHERTGRLGGQVRLASTVGNRPHLARHVDWLEREIHRLGVEIRLESELSPADVDRIVEDGVDAVVIAAGSTAFVPPEAAGLDCPSVTEFELFDGTAEPRAGARVLVYDAEGHRRGADAALLLAGRGVAVTLATPHESPLTHLEPPNRPELEQRLRASTTRVLPDQQLAGVGDGRLLLRDAWTEEPIEAEAYQLVVFVGYRRPLGELHGHLSATAPEMPVHVVGDAKAPRLLRNAISDGVRAGIAL
ncbi:FAD-dependent oxidoreductase [Saccharopolyspora erythraea]|uniref:oxidoreductase n=1 Tax=Saccharopolyspora erythraea TaxID=1836 RepID=UPI001BAC97B8|nr:FAD-dependent oxidoreductase [Saccharopolyspora erythraea]QUH02018.1 FAD-dependent oxidoreductase [Saccharopolyspora erythraea]